MNQSISIFFASCTASRCASRDRDKSDQDSGSFSHHSNNYNVNAIVSLDSDGFTVSNGDNYNDPGKPYVYVAFR